MDWLEEVLQHLQLLDVPISTPLAQSARVVERAS
jgi:hypothetical protein